MQKYRASRRFLRPHPQSRSDLMRKAWPEAASFMLSHCDHCAFIETFYLGDGAVGKTCALDGEPILAGVIDCERYVPMEG
jgi:hypothetical protein